MEKNSPEDFGNGADVIAFPAVGTYQYNAQRLWNYEASARRDEKWSLVHVLQTISELYDADLVDIDWDPATGEPIVVKKLSSTVE
mgnify:FL=1